MAYGRNSDLESPETETEDSYTKTTDQLDPEELLIRVKEWWLEDYPLCDQFHSDARSNFRFRAGDQYSDADKSYLNDPANKRIALVFNRIDPVIDAVVGAEITNRQEVRFLPRQVGDASVNEVLTEAARWFRDECDAEHEESSAFADAATCGMGWTETRLDYETNPDGKPLIKRRDPIEMYWDASASQANITDARRIYRIRQDVPLNEAKTLFPTYPDGKPIEDDDCYDASWARTSRDEETPYVINRPQGVADHETAEGKKDRTVTLIQVQWWEREEYYRAMATNPMTGQSRTEDLTPEQHTGAQLRARELNIPYRAIKQVKKCYYEAFLGKEVLSVRKLKAPSGKPQTEFNFVPITGKYDREKGYWYGLVRGMEGPQKFANKWLSTAVEIMARNAKGGLMLEEGAVNDQDEFESKWATPGSNAYFRSGAITGGRVQPKPESKFPSDFMEMTQFAISSIRDTTGVNAEILGMADANQPASLEYQRRQSATIILAPLFDSLRRYRRIEGRVLLYLITEYLSDGRLIRIVGKESEQYIPLIRDPMVTEYDVIVDDAPSSPSQKELVWNSLSQMAPLLAGMALPPEVYLALLDYSPFPASVAVKIKQAVAQSQQNAPPPPPTPAEIAAQKAQVDIQAKTQMNQQELQHKQNLSQLELQNELQKNQLHMEAKRQEAGMKMTEESTKSQLAMAHEVKKSELKHNEQQFDHEIRQAEIAGKVRIPKPKEVDLTPLHEGLKTLGAKHDQLVELVQTLAKPRKRTLVRGKDGRASHAIDEILH